VDGPDQKGDKPFQLPALIAALVAALLAAVSFTRAPVPDSARPPAGKALESNSQLIDARLWEDPLDSLLLPDTADRADAGCKPTTPPLEWPRRTEDRDRQRPAVLVVFADSGRSSEDRERRIRARAAVLAALNRWGYEPNDPEHLSIRCLDEPAAANPPPAGGGEKTALTGNAVVAGTSLAVTTTVKAEAPASEAAAAAQPAKRLAVAVEQFRLLRDKEEQDRAKRLGGSDPYAGRAALLAIYWVGDGTLRSQSSARRVFQNYSRALRLIEQDVGEKMPMQVLGPLNRDVADALAHSARCLPPGSPAQSAVAGDDDATMQNCAADLVPAHRAFRSFHTHPAPPVDGIQPQPIFQSFELGNSDGELARSLIAELELRGLNLSRPNDNYPMLQAGQSAEIQPYACLFDDHVALLNEWDTAFAREFRRTFATELGRTASSLKAEIKRWETPNLHGFAFTRGLDGKSLRQEKPAAGKDTTKPGDDSKQPQPGDYQQSSGTSQRDAVGRLADQIEARDAALKAACGRDAVGIHTIGILASDFYDKLMLLQTLRARFPNMLFFTIGLDARLLDRQNSPFTRNLIVSAQFDTALAPAIQRYITPFRDSGQTAQFLATSLAVLSAYATDRPETDRDITDMIGSWNKLGPRVFEIGLQEAHPLNAFSEGRKCEPAVNSETSDNLFRCVDVNPPRNPPRGGALKSAIAMIVVLAAVYLLGATVWAPSTRWTFAIFLGAGLLLVILPLAIFGVISQFASFWREEPLAWIDGVSVWPSLWLRWIAFVLSIVMLAMAGRMIMGSAIDTGREFDLAALPPAPLPSWRRRCRRTLYLTREILRWRLRAALLGAKLNPAGEPVFRSAHESWVLFRIGIAPGPQTLIGFIWAVLVMFVIFRVWQTHPTIAPIRGPISINLFALVATANGFFFLLLLFLSLSTALRLKVLARDLSRVSSNWPEHVIQAAKHQLQSRYCKAATIERARWEARLSQRADDFLSHDKTLRSAFDAAMDIFVDISLLARVSRGNEWVLYMPGAVVSIILASRWSYFDAWTLDPIVIGILSLFTASAVLTVIIANSAGRKARSTALQELDSIAAGIRTQQENLGELIRHIRAYVLSINDGIFRAGQWNLLRALILPIASATGLRGIEVLMNIFQ